MTCRQLTQVMKVAETGCRPVEAAQSSATMTTIVTTPKGRRAGKKGRYQPDFRELLLRVLSGAMLNEK